MQVVERARKFMAQGLAAAEFKRLMKHKTSSATDQRLEPGNFILVWRENIVNSRIGEFIDPLTFFFSLLSKIAVIDQNGTKRV